MLREGLNRLRSTDLDPSPPRRTLFMKPRLTLVALGLAALVLATLGLQAQDSRKSPPNPKDLTESQQQLQRKFSEFQDKLIILKDRLSKGTVEERRRAEVLGEVLDEAKNLAINHEFSTMANMMKNLDVNSPSLLKQAEQQGVTISTKI